MANSRINQSLSSLVLYGLIPVVCWALLLQCTSSMVNSQELGDSSLPIPGSNLLDNATSFLQGFSKKFDSTKNFTLTPGNLFNRVRERIHTRLESLRNRWLETRMRMGNRTISLIDRIMSRLDRKGKDKSGKESSNEPFSMFRSFLESLRNTVQGMVHNLQNTDLKRPIKWVDDTSLSLKNELEREKPGSKAISELNAALKKLDKETRTKFNSI